MSFGKFITVFLGCYFAFVIYKASDKLHSDQIGITYGKVSSNTVQEINLFLFINYYQNHRLIKFHPIFKYGLKKGSEFL